MPRTCVDEWLGYTCHDKLITLGWCAVVLSLPVSVPAFAVYVIARGCYRKVIGIGE